MSTSVIEPGTRLAGRYRLEERISDSGGSSLWKAIDEILARAVAVRTFDPEFPRVAEVVTSARAASRLTDPRLTQVFDADDSGESAYVVSEWVAGEPLEQMLAKAPLEPGRAATLLYEAAEAMAAAHAAGLSHLCLTPRDLVWTTGGTVKLLGIATDAVLCDRTCDDPAAEDVRGLGRMLYAALTAHWPGDEEGSGLPAAPRAGDVPRAPRQVQAGISHAVDAIVCRCLGIGETEPLETPADLAKALRGVPRTPLPLFAGLGSAQPPAPRPAPAQHPAGPHGAAPHGHAPGPQQHGRQPGPPHPHPPAGRRTHQPSAHQQQAPAHVPPPRTQHTALPPGTAPSPAGGRSGKSANRALLGVAAAALTVIVGLGAWALMGDDEPAGKGGATHSAVDPNKSSPPPKPAVAELRAVGAVGMEDATPGHHDGQIDKNAEAVIDGKSKPYWETQTYMSAKFGNYANGFGVVLDMGKTVKVSYIKVSTPVSGVPVQLRVGASRSLASLPVVGQVSARPDGFKITADREAKGQYVLVWFPNEVPAGFKAKLGEVAVFGSAA